jgi:predicted alpha/beta superfamily hydrolase
MKRWIAMAAVALVHAGAAFAQTGGGVPLERARTWTLESRALGQTRTLDVSLPSDYERNPERRYPVLYVLDGDWEQEMAAAIARFYADAGVVPPMIVVGLRTADRFHTLTTTPAPGRPAPAEPGNAGGADAFLRFVGDELVPWAARTFRTDSMRVLVGHSLGGLFTAHALAERPTLFTGWVLLEPSLWWNDGRERNAMVAALRSPAGRHARVMAVNMERLGLDTTRWGGDAPMIREIDTEGETHSSMALPGLARALRTLFADFLPAEWRPGSRPIAMLERYDSLTFRLGYAVPVPEATFATVARMSIDARYYVDAAEIIDRMERTLGASAASRGLREKLATDRANERPGFVPLEFPSRRPTSAEARAFIGTWRAVGADFHEVEVRAAGDSIVVRDAQRLPDGRPFEGDRPVVQITADGTLEWGLPVFRGLAALLVLRARIQPDGTMRVTREVRGWAPVGPGPDVARTEVFRRATG